LYKNSTRSSQPGEAPVPAREEPRKRWNTRYKKKRLNNDMLVAFVKQENEQAQAEHIAGVG
jgi:hypothetical protein